MFRVSRYYDSCGGPLSCHVLPRRSHQNIGFMRTGREISCIRLYPERAIFMVHPRQHYNRSNQSKMRYPAIKKLNI